MKYKLGLVCFLLVVLCGQLFYAEVVALNIKGIKVDFVGKDRDTKNAPKPEPEPEPETEDTALSADQKELIELRVKIKYQQERINELKAQLNNKQNCRSEENLNEAIVEDVFYSYYILTRDGVFLGKSQSKAEARGTALKKCMENSFPKSQCKDSHIKSDDDFRPKSEQHSQKEYSYYIANRSGTFIGKSKNPAEARAIALQKCQDSTFPKSQCTESSLKAE